MKSVKSVVLYFLYGALYTKSDVSHEAHTREEGDREPLTSLTSLISKQIAISQALGCCSTSGAKNNEQSNSSGINAQNVIILPALR